jgi:voltage-gated sodium channel
MTTLFQSIAKAPWFTNLVTAMILVAGVLVGLETSHSLVAQFGTVLHTLDKIILWIFVAEAVVKIGAEGSKPWRYFLDPWNIFDFAIVAVCFMPIDGQYVAVLRLARLLRVLKLVRALPQLQVLVGALLRSIPSMGYIGLLLFMLFYVYSVAGVFLFGANDPIHFGSLPMALVNLFRVVTFDDWANLLYVEMFGCDKAVLYEGREHLCTAPSGMPVFSVFYFVSFILLGAMVILNLFIGVITNGMEDAKRENEFEERQSRREAGVMPSLVDDVDTLLSRMSELQDELETLKLRISRDEADAIAIVKAAKEKGQG